LKEEIVVGIADYRIGKGESLLTTIGLGSCIGVVLYDPGQKVAALGHFMLPDSSAAKVGSDIKLAKYGDSCIREMIKELDSSGAKRSKIIAKAAGGASMFKRLSANSLMDISSRNIESLKKALKESGIKLISEDLGGERGRTITFDVGTGSLTVKIVDPSRMDSNRYVVRTI